MQAKLIQVLGAQLGIDQIEPRLERLAFLNLLSGKHLLLHLP